MKPTHAIFFFAALLPVISAAQQTCFVQGQAEQSRIEREFAARRPAQGDRDGELTWARNLHAALASAAKRAEDCARANKPAASPAAGAAMDECIAGVRRRLEQLDRRDRGRTLSMQEQTTRRNEDQSLLDERMACERASKR